MEIYKTISAVQSELATIGISKDSKNQQQGFKFRGIDAVLNALAPILAKHKLCILPRCLDRECVERQTKAGGTLFYVTVKVDYAFVAEDGSQHIVTTYGEAMDSGDKATNKAMSAAYKYAAFQAFCIPTEETATDADLQTHEVVSITLYDKSFDSMCESIQAAETVPAIGNQLKLAVKAGASKDQLKVLQSAATKRKGELLSEQS